MEAIYIRACLIQGINIIDHPFSMALFKDIIYYPQTPRMCNKMKREKGLFVAS